MQYDEISGAYYVDYNGFVPVFIEAIKEQQAQILDQEKRIAELEEALAKLTGASGADSGSRLETEDSNSTSTGTALMQNTPNPFDEETRVRFFLPQEVKQAALFIYDLQGRQVRRMDLKERGESYVTIRAGELKAGRYLYTLIADGQEVSTKKMILTR